MTLPLSLLCFIQTEDLLLFLFLVVPNFIVFTSIAFFTIASIAAVFNGRHTLTTIKSC